MCDLDRMSHGSPCRCLCNNRVSGIFCEDIELGPHGKDNSHGPFGRAKHGEKKRRNSQKRRDETTSYGMNFASVMQYEFHFLVLIKVA